MHVVQRRDQSGCGAPPHYAVDSELHVLDGEILFTDDRNARPRSGIFLRQAACAFTNANGAGPRWSSQPGIEAERCT